MEFLEGPAETAARRLLNGELERTLPDGTLLRGRIIETEAYDQADPASHSFRGPSARTAAMFGSAGRAYIYFTYGMYFCLNVVTGPAGHGAGVLLRAIEPLEGQEVMRRNRGGRPDNQLANGPGKLCQALVIDKTLYGHDLLQPPLQLVVRPPLPADNIGQSPRIGISQAADVPWRFFILGSPGLSR